jgi:phospholipase C
MNNIRWVSCLAAIGLSAAAHAATDTELQRIDHIVVIYAENRSFDHLYGLFPGAEGIAQATPEQRTQLDHNGQALPHLPPTYSRGKVMDKYPTQGLPNGPFRIDAPPVNGRLDEVMVSPWHLFYQNQAQIAGGKNNRFVAMSDVGAWVMGHIDGSKMKLWRWAQDYTLADHFFMGAFGGSFLNHQWLVCACTPVDTQAPASARAQLDEKGQLRLHPDSPGSVLQGPVKPMDGRVTPDGFVVNTSQPPYQPSGIAPASAQASDLALANPDKHPVPPQTQKTIGDTLSAKGVSWAWFAGGWQQALDDGRRDPQLPRQVIYTPGPSSPMFQPHHQPFNYFARFAPGSADRARHLRDGEDFLRAIDAGQLPQVTFYKPSGRYNEHPSYTDLASGDAHIDEVLHKLQKSPQWPRMAVIVTYDENGGFWDHVPPPSGEGWGDRWGPGTRIPAIVVSPFARRGHVDKTVYDTTSVLKFITRRFGLEPLPGVRQRVGDLTAAFEFK